MTVLSVRVGAAPRLNPLLLQDCTRAERQMSLWSYLHEWLSRTSALLFVAPTLITFLPELRASEAETLTHVLWTDQTLKDYIH